MSSHKILILVYPHSLCSSADRILGINEAMKARKLVIDELEQWNGPVLVLDSSNIADIDELSNYPSLNDAINSLGDIGMGRRYASDAANYSAVAVGILKSNQIPENTQIGITGAWRESGGTYGRLNATEEALKDAGFTNVSILDSAPSNTSCINSEAVLETHLAELDMPRKNEDLEEARIAREAISEEKLWRESHSWQDAVKRAYPDVSLVQRARDAVQAYLSSSRISEYSYSDTINPEGISSDALSASEDDDSNMMMASLSMLSDEGILLVVLANLNQEHDGSTFPVATVSKVRKWQVDQTKGGNTISISSRKAAIDFDSPEVKVLQEQLRNHDRSYNPKTDYNDPDGTPSAFGIKAKALRAELFKLTGDSYGIKRNKSGAKSVKDVKPSEELLEATYLSPDDVPLDVSNWVKRNCSLLFSDATDAVRWSRIEDSLDHERYEEGEITLYRALNIVNEMGDIDIRPGDWVTTIESYAEEHNRRYFDGMGQVLSMVCNGADVLFSPTGNSEEAIYAPRQLSGTAIHASNLKQTASKEYVIPICKSKAISYKS